MAYKETILRAVQLGIIKGGDLAFVDISHDSWCKIYKGGECNCIPDIVFKLPDGRHVAINPDGTAKVPH